MTRELCRCGHFFSLHRFDNVKRKSPPPCSVATGSQLDKCPCLHFEASEVAA